MKISPTSSTPPGQIGASTASSSDSSPYTDYMNNGSQRAGSSSNRLGVSSTNPTSNQTIKPSGSGTSASTLSGLPQTTDHIQRLTQMTHDMGLVSSAGKALKVRLFVLNHLHKSLNSEQCCFLCFILALNSFKLNADLFVQ